MIDLTDTAQRNVSMNGTHCLHCGKRTLQETGLFVDCGCPRIDRAVLARMKQIGARRMAWYQLRGGLK